MPAGPSMLTGWSLVGNNSEKCGVGAPPFLQLSEISLPGCEYVCALRANCQAFEFAALSNHTRCRLYAEKPLRTIPSTANYLCYTRDCDLKCATMQRFPLPPLGGASPPPPVLPPPPNLSCEQRLRPHADLRDCGLTFVRADLSRLFLIGVNLEGVDLSGAKLDGANLAHAKLRRAKAVNASFRFANMYQIDLSEAQLSGAIFEWADLRESMFQRSSIDHSSFAAADLRGWDATHTTASNVQFDRALLSDTVQTDVAFYNSSFISVDFKRSRWEFANFTKCDFADARFHDLIVVDGVLDGSSFFRCSFPRAQMLGPTSLNGANLRYATFQGCSLPGLQAKQVTAHRADFSFTNLDLADFAYSDLWRANFTGASLRKANFRGAMCGGVYGTSLC